MLLIGVLCCVDNVSHCDGSESDSSDHLVVDESRSASRPQLKPGSLKIRLPGNYTFFGEHRSLNTQLAGSWPILTIDKTGQILRNMTDFCWLINS